MCSGLDEELPRPGLLDVRRERHHVRQSRRADRRIGGGRGERGGWQFGVAHSHPLRRNVQ